jgi:hypothetical protein
MTARSMQTSILQSGFSSNKYSKRLLSAYDDPFEAVVFRSVSHPLAAGKCSLMLEAKQSKMTA